MDAASPTSVGSRPAGLAGRLGLGGRFERPGMPRERRRAMRRRRRLVRTGALVAGVGALALWLVTSQNAPGAGTGPGAPPEHPVKVDVLLPATAAVGAAVGAAPAPAALPWPPSGQSAVAVPLLGYAAQSGAEVSVPVASLTKMMTAYVVLRDHPISLGTSGPRIALSAADVANFGLDTVTDQANVQLQPGEVLTEYQMLEGLLVHSANDLAYSLACWDAGSVGAFVAKMNATAARLGMTDTHFADASGFSSSSESSAADLLKIAAADMANPVFAQIVAMPAVTLPVAGTVGSYTPLVGTPGVLGVKSGYTNAAGGGDVLAYRAAVGGRTFLVLAAVISQEGPTVLDRAGNEALALARATADQVQSATVAPRGDAVARVAAAGHTVAATAAASATVLYMTGDRVHQAVHVRVPANGARAGALVGTARFSIGAEEVSVPVRLLARLP